jgi:hypothetical protein
MMLQGSQTSIGLPIMKLDSQYVDKTKHQWVVATTAAAVMMVEVDVAAVIGSEW